MKLTSAKLKIRILLRLLLQQLKLYPPSRKSLIELQIIRIPMKKNTLRQLISFLTQV